MNSVTSRLMSVLALLALVLGTFLVPSSAHADAATETMDLDPVYAKTSYTLEELTGLVPTDFTQPFNTEDSELYWDGDVAKIRVDGFDSDNVIAFNFEANDTWITATLPVYETRQPTAKRRNRPPRVTLTNVYDHPVVVKCRDDLSGKLDFVVTLAAKQTKTMRVHYRRIICNSWVLFKNQKIQVYLFQVDGFKVK